MKTKEILNNGLKEALDGIEPTHGAWTLSGFTACEVNVGRVELKSGKTALVRLKVEADEDEIESACDNLNELPILN